MESRLCAFFLLLIAFQSTMAMGNVLPPPQCREVLGTSRQKFEFCLNFLCYEAEFYLRTSIGKGIDDIHPNLIQGPTPVGARVANLEPGIRRIIEEFGYQAIGNIRAILDVLDDNSIRRPQLNYSVGLYSAYVNQAFNTTLSPPFDLYANTINYLSDISRFASITQECLRAILDSIANNELRRVGTGIMGTVSERVGVLRAISYLRYNVTVSPYRFNLGTLNERIIAIINRLGMCGNKDEALIVPLQLGAENRTTSNVVSADVYSLTVARVEREVMRIVYGTGNASNPGGFFPNGLSGEIARNIMRSGLN